MRQAPRGLRTAPPPVLPQDSPPAGSPLESHAWGDYRMFVLDRLQMLFTQQAQLEERVRKSELRWAVLFGVWAALQAALAIWAALK